MKKKSPFPNCPREPSLYVTKFCPSTKGLPKNPFGLTCTKIAKRGLVQILPTYLPKFYLLPFPKTENPCF